MRRRILTTGTLGLLATLAIVLVSAGSAAARAAPTLAIQPGQTIYLTHMTLTSTASYGSWAYALILNTNSDLLYNPELGWKAPSVDPALANKSWTNNLSTNPAGDTAYLTFYITDSWGDLYATYQSDGTSDGTGGASYNHAKVGWLKGKATVSINDTGNGTYWAQDYQPALGKGSFNATVTYKAPR